MLDDAITIPQTGAYKISVYLRLGDITTVGKEVGIRLNKNNGSYLSNQVWKYQYKRLRDTFDFCMTLNVNDTICPELYIDNITSTAATTISDAYMYIQFIPTKEVS